MKFALKVYFYSSISLVGSGSVPISNMDPDPGDDLNTDPKHCLHVGRNLFTCTRQEFAGGNGVRPQVLHVLLLVTGTVHALVASPPNANVGVAGLELSRADDIAAPAELEGAPRRLVLLVLPLRLQLTHDLRGGG